MNAILLLKFILLVIFLFCSAFFSASETALFSLDALRLKRLAQEGRSASLVLKLLANPISCLTAILAGNTLVNIAISAVLTSMVIDVFGPGAIAVSIILTTFVLLLLGEVTPKTIAIHNNERLSLLAARPLSGFKKMIGPFLNLAGRICDYIIGFFHLRPCGGPTLTQEEFRTVMEVGHRHGVVGKSQKEMVLSILELTTTTAREVMTPRTDICAVSGDCLRVSALEFARKVRHSRLPVYQGSLDHILGCILTKDLFLLQEVPLTELVKPVMFIPAAKRIDELIRDFYRQDFKMAVVVDEYGGTSGLVTLEDILEEIFGELYDEFEVPQELIQAISSRSFRLSGKTPVYQVNRTCGLSVPEGNYETIAGFLLGAFAKIPAQGDSVNVRGAKFSVEEMAGRRIKTIRVELR